MSATPHNALRTEKPPDRWRGIRRGALLALGLSPWALVVVLTAINLLYTSRIGPIDDAFITYRVARNLAAGHGPVFNPGESVLSITTPGYMLLLAAVTPLSDDTVALGLALNGLALLAIGALLIDLSGAVARPWAWLRSPRSRAGTVAYITRCLAAIIAVSLTLLFAPLTDAVGMETALYMTALLAVFAAYRRALQQPAGAQRWLIWTALAAGAAFLLRPDGLLVGGVVALHWLATQRRPIPWVAMGLALLLTLPWVVFAWIYYGSPIPNTLAAKSTQSLAQDSVRWGRELLTLAQRWSMTQPAAAVLAVLGLATTIYPWRRSTGGMLTTRRLMLGWAALYVVIHTALDVRAYFWYYAPLAPVVALMAGEGAKALVNLLSSGLVGAGKTRRWVTSGVGVILLLLLAAVLGSSTVTAGRLALSSGTRQRESAYWRTALVLRELCRAPGQAPVAAAEIGVLGYASNCPMVDFSGLLQPELAHLRAEPDDKMTWVIKRYAPPLIVLSGSDGFPHQVVEPAWFHRRYEPADIQDEGGFQSVIYQHGPGVPEQRDLGAASWWQAPSLLAGRSLSLMPGQPVTASLAFPLDASPAITLHAYLPPESSLSVSTDGQPLAELDGEQAAWNDFVLPLAELDGEQAAWNDFVLPLAAAAGRARVTLELVGTAGDQPAAVAWIESNAFPAVHFFQPLVDLSQRPRPRLSLRPGESHTIELAAVQPGAVQAELLYRDRPGVVLAVLADGRSLATLGGADGWRTERIDLPPTAGQRVKIELRSQGNQPVDLVYVALTGPSDQPASQP